MKLFKFDEGEDGVFVLAATMGDALGKWRNWLVCQSEGQLSRMDPKIDGAYPASIVEIAEGDEIVT